MALRIEWHCNPDVYSILINFFRQRKQLQQYCAQDSNLVQSNLTVLLQGSTMFSGLLQLQLNDTMEVTNTLNFYLKLDACAKCCMLGHARWTKELYHTTPHIAWRISYTFCTFFTCVQQVLKEQIGN